MGRLLLVDDDPVMILDQVTHALGPHGVEVQVARTAEEGLRQAEARETLRRYATLTGVTATTIAPLRRRSLSLADNPR